ncbi:GNAT family N-acetyltransferase [Dendrosporobacter sp. 1207_IL3150]|uniref:GNAT family N-acetyltransferase n=1 Tax=Dendrosporobacter sp. 1207_IL3150 TaxID=3084054 RepID=UPI002FDA0238
MNIDGAEVTIEKVHYNDLRDLENIFTKEFGEEVNSEIIKQRVHRVRQFYYILRPLSNVSLWVKNLFNIYIIRVGLNLAGFIQVSYLSEKQIHLDYIAISKKYRGKGIGSVVLRALLENIAEKNNYDVILEVRSDNPAKRLYERLGFVTQAQVLHYEKSFSSEAVLDTETSSELKLQPVKENDRLQIYRLYRASIPCRLQQVVRREYQEFNPSLFIRNLNWLKNRLMHNEAQAYVVRIGERIIASVDVRSYPKATFHVLSMILHPRYEKYRKTILSKALMGLAEKYRKGSVSTTIYNDSIAKQEILENLGFAQQEVYYLMLRLSNREYKENNLDRQEKYGMYPNMKYGKRISKLPKLPL